MRLFSPSPKNTNPEKNMTLVEHLEELRTRLILSIVFLLLGVILGFMFAKRAVNFLVRPFQRIEIVRSEEMIRIRIEEDGVLRLAAPEDIARMRSKNPEALADFFQGRSSYRIAFYLPGTPAEQEPDFIYGYNLEKPVFFNPLDPITLYFKAAAILGVIIALPFILYQLWLFIIPGLKPNEKKTLVVLLCLGAVLFPAGAAFAYLMFGMILNFLMNFQIASMEPLLEIFKFVNLELRLMIGFGILFELPLVVMFLTFLGILHPRQLRKYRPHTIVGLAVVSMIFTPPDPLSMLIMLIPLVMLYEISIWLSVPLARKREMKE